ncbi:hypothetical protein G6F56_000460 [Rhizopus delemar]|nr:hypothetical protein G6F56_000460 [Rhizopus delemar]
MVANAPNDCLNPNNELDVMKGEVGDLLLTIRNLEDELGSLKSRTDTPISQALANNPTYNWKIKINKGHFRIETGIQNMSQLLDYQPSIRYLSPISSKDKNSILVNFKTQDYGSLYSITGRILSKRLKNTTTDYLTPTIEPSFLGSRTIMDQLINIYFSCHNINIGWLYETSFRKKYKQIDTPLNDLLCVAICCHVCTTPCHHLDFTTRQRREMSDFFYLRTKDILLDQFDEPSKRLENVIASNLLFTYMHMTLKFIEYDSIITMAYHILLGLKAEYSKLETPPATVEYALYSRNLANNHCIRSVVDGVVGRMVTKQPLPFPKLEVFPDEREETKEFMKIQDWILYTHGQSFTDKLSEQVHSIYIGDACTVNLETIFRVDEVIAEHRRSIPNRWSIFKDIENEEQCKKAMGESFDFFSIYAYVHFNVICLGFYASFLQPVSLDNENTELIQVIQQHSFERSRKTARLSLHGLKRLLQLENKASCYYQLAIKDLVLYVFDSIILHHSSPVENSASEAHEMFKDCYEIMLIIQNIKENDIPSQMGKGEIKEFIQNRKADISYYSKYPDPWCALMSDLSQFL